MEKQSNLLFAQESILCNKTKLEKEDYEATLRFVGERENKV